MKRNQKKSFLFIFIFCILFEIIVVNHSYWASLFHKGVPYEVYNFEDENGRRLEYGQELLLDGTVYYAKNLNIDIDSIYIYISYIHRDDWDKKMSQINGVITCRWGISDEGHYSIYQLPARLIRQNSASDGYFSLKTYGKVKDISLSFPYDQGRKIIIDKIVLNGIAPFKFNVFRFSTFFFLIGIVYIAVIKKENFEDYCKESKLQTYIKYCVLFCIVVLLLYIQSWVSHIDSMHYKDLAEALLNGRLYICENKDSILAGLSNPYDIGLRNAEGAYGLWDYALYEGKYYIYFGILPVIIFYMPYRLITGVGMPDYQVHLILVTVIVIASFVLVDTLIKKYCKKIDFITVMLISSCVAIQSGAVFIIKRASVYTVSYGTGLAFVMLGLIMILKAVSKEGVPSKIKTIIGATLLALSVAARPQYVFMSLFVLPIYWTYVKKWKKNLGLASCIIIPYAVIATGLMLYNYLRFGSVTDFGANYQITPHDMTHMGTQISRWLLGIWYYLFDLPTICPEFPYLISKSINTKYQGYLYQEAVIGGAYMLVPLCLVSFWGMKKKNYISLKNNGLNGIYVISIVNTLLLAVFDMILCGYVTRYQIDFRIYMLISAIVVVICVVNRLNEKSGDVHIFEKTINMICIVTLIMAGLTLFSNYESPDYLATNPLFWCKMRDFFGIH